jgi:hypothetical protein
LISAAADCEKIAAVASKGRMDRNRRLIRKAPEEEIYVIWVIVVNALRVDAERFRPTRVYFPRRS